MEKDQPGPGSMGISNYWLKLGEWKRTKSVVGFAFLVTLCCIGVKIVTALIGHGVWSGGSPFTRVLETSGESWLTRL